MGAWLLLFIAIAFEISGTTAMRAFAATDTALSLGCATGGISISYFFASRAMEKIPVGVAYAVWSGVGLAGVCALSFFLFKEPMPPLKLFGIGFVIWGMTVINMDNHCHAKKSER